MGFSYVQDPFTNRMKLCCDFCNSYKDDPRTGIKSVRKIECPHGYCQAWATCDQCKKLGNHKASSTGMPNDPDKENHKLCARGMAEIEVNHLKEKGIKCVVSGMTCKKCKINVIRIEGEKAEAHACITKNCENFASFEQIQEVQNKMEALVA